MASAAPLLPCFGAWEGLGSNRLLHVLDSDCAHQNLAACGTNQGNRTRRFAPPLRARGAGGGSSVAAIGSLCHAVVALLSGLGFGVQG